MDAVVHLSRREGLPRALPQALAAKALYRAAWEAWFSISHRACNPSAASMTTACTQGL